MATPQRRFRERVPSAGWTDAEVARAIRGLVARTQYERGLSREARQLLRTAFDSIAADLRKLEGTRAAASLTNRARLASLLVDFDSRLARAYGAVRRRTLQELGGLAAVERDAALVDLAITATEHAAAAPAVESALRGNAFVSAARIETIAALPIQGKTLGTWWEGEVAAMTRATRAAIQTGLITGEPLRDIARRLVPDRGSADPAVYRQAAARANTIVRTAATAVHAESALASYAEVGEEITGAYEILATRDNRTSAICIALDGQVFRYDDPKRKAPPFHLNCRTTVIPVMNWEGLGIAPPGPREPLGFPSLAAWLKQQPKATQNGLLGPTRAQWFREGRLPLRELIDGDTRVRTLEELRTVLVEAPSAPLRRAVHPGGVKPTATKRAAPAAPAAAAPIARAPARARAPDLEPKPVAAPGTAITTKPMGWTDREWRTFRRTGVLPLMKSLTPGEIIPRRPRRP